MVATYWKRKRNTPHFDRNDPEWIETCYEIQSWFPNVHAAENLNDSQKQYISDMMLISKDFDTISEAAALTVELVREGRKIRNHVRKAAEKEGHWDRDGYWSGVNEPPFTPGRELLETLLAEDERNINRAAANKKTFSSDEEALMEKMANFSSDMATFINKMK